MNEEFIKEWAKRGLILMHEPVQLGNNGKTYLTFSTNKKICEIIQSLMVTLLFHSVRQLINNFHRESKEEEGLYGVLRNERKGAKILKFDNKRFKTKIWNYKPKILN